MLSHRYWTWSGPHAGDYLDYEAHEWWLFGRILIYRRAKEKWHGVVEVEVLDGDNVPVYRERVVAA